MIFKPKRVLYGSKEHMEFRLKFHGLRRLSFSFFDSCLDENAYFSNHICMEFSVIQTVSSSYMNGKWKCR